MRVRVVRGAPRLPLHLLGELPLPRRLALRLPLDASTQLLDRHAGRALLVRVRVRVRVRVPCHYSGAP